MPFCKAKFDEMPDLNVHIASVHEGKKPFKCEICDFEQFLKSCTVRFMSQNHLSRKFLNPF